MGILIKNFDYGNEKNLFFFILSNRISSTLNVIAIKRFIISSSQVRPLHIVSKTIQLFSIIVILMMSLLSHVLLNNHLSRRSDLLNMDLLLLNFLNNNNLIQITSTSSYTDDFGNFHVIGEVNNTSTQPQTNIVITALLSDTTTTMLLVGNHSAFSSIETLRSGELSPFDIVIQDPQQS